MAREYFKVWHSYLKSVELLNDAERGRLFTAMLEYSITGETPELRGNERFLFPTMKANLDREIKSYSLTAEKNSENGKKGGRPPLEDKSEKKPKNPVGLSKSEKSQDKDKDEDKDEDKELKKEKIKKENEFSFSTDVFEGRSFSDEMKAKLSEWLLYKKERRETYKPTGLKSLLSETENKLKVYEERDIISLLGDCMANNWRGIIWDRLKGKEKRSAEPEKRWNDL